MLLGCSATLERRGNESIRILPFRTRRHLGRLLSLMQKNLLQQQRQQTRSLPRWSKRCHLPPISLHQIHRPVLIMTARVAKLWSGSRKVSPCDNVAISRNMEIAVVSIATKRHTALYLSPCRRRSRSRNVHRGSLRNGAKVSNGIAGSHSGR